MSDELNDATGGASVMWLRGGTARAGMSNWWNFCHDCGRAENRAENWYPSTELGTPVDAALVLAALDLAEHHGRTGHQRGVLWAGAAGAERAPTAAELDVCAEHPAFVVPEMGGRFLWLSKPLAFGCVLMPREFDMHGDGSKMRIGYPAAIPAWMHPAHPGRDIRVGQVLSDDANVCRVCSCVAFGVTTHTPPA